LTKGKAAAYKVNHARIMLWRIPAQLGGWKDETISQALNIVATIEQVRQRLVEEGLEVALSQSPKQTQTAMLGRRERSTKP